MEIERLTPETEILNELGRRLARIRKQKGYSQTRLAEHAGIGIATLKRVERGHDSQLETWLKLLKSLDMAHAIEAILPENFKSPMAEAKSQSKRSAKPPPSASNIVWKDEMT